MKRRLFLTGPSGCGKTTMIQKTLADRIWQGGGFCTVRDRAETGKLRGFDLVPAGGYGEGQRFLDLEGDRPRVHLEVFRGLGVECLRSAGERKFAVLDEIGGVELLDEDFIDALGTFLQSGQPCIGVMKGTETADKLAERMGLTMRYELARRALYQHLQNDPDTLLLEVRSRDDVQAMEQVARWAAAYT